jgi:hypothetical protein
MIIIKQGNRVKFDIEHWHDHVTETVETNNDRKVTILLYQQA